VCRVCRAGRYRPRVHTGIEAVDDNEVAAFLALLRR